MAAKRSGVGEGGITGRMGYLFRAMIKHKVTNPEASKNEGVGGIR